MQIGAEPGLSGARKAPQSYSFPTSAPHPRLRHERAVAERWRASQFPELDCIRHRLPPGTLARIERRAEALGVGAEQVLITQHHMSEEEYVDALAAWLGVPTDPLTDIGELPSGQADTLFGHVRAGALAFRRGGGTSFVVCPRDGTARLLAKARQRGPLMADLRLTTSAAMRAFATRSMASDIDQVATDALREEHPHLSAATTNTAAVLWSAFAALACCLLALFAPELTVSVGIVLLSLAFIAWTGLRIVCALIDEPRTPPRIELPDRDLPVYTVLVALYREANAVDSLVESLRALDYPTEKLDIKLILEPDDHSTRRAVEALELSAPFEVVIAPPSGPRTKPKALNAALPFARGAFTCVFDAEDRPDPDQLRAAVATFAAADERLACVQARLTIDNTADGWLARIFTAEYAGLFDVFLPSLAARGLPLPLGGSSNHFRTDVLRRAGAWDPYNVTEDADLGVRLARAGYRSAVIASSTYEEAPARVSPWLKQRTRWFKGWLRTWLVHSRTPLDLCRELGVGGVSCFQLVVFGTVLAALLHPLFLASVSLAVIGAIIAPEPANLEFAALALGAVFGGYLSAAVLGWIGLSRRRLYRERWVLLMMPVLWVLLSVAAWRALIQLVRDPVRWEKTEHGVARSSRLATRPGRPYM